MQRTTLETYLDVWHLVQRLKSVNEKTPITSPSGHYDIGVRDQVWTLIEVLKERTPDENNVGLHPFEQTRAFHDSLLDFSDELNLALANSRHQSVTTPNTVLTPHLCRRLRGLAAKLEDAFRIEIARRTFFLAPERDSLLEYLSRQTFLKTEKEIESFGYLPRIAQTNLMDAGKCLVYGLSGAAIGLSLQAVESTLRYYYWRHGGSLLLKKGRREYWAAWSDMMSWLKREGCLPGGESYREFSYRTLDNLRDRYRNAVAHGRALGSSQRQDKEAEDVFSACLSAVLAFGSETVRRPTLTLEIEVSSDLSFDVAVATYLFFWDPELPDVTRDSMKVNPELPTGKLVDSTVGKTIPRDGGDTSASRAVKDYLHVQDNFASTVEPLIRFAACHQRGEVQSNFNPQSPRPTDVNLPELFEGIQLKEGDDPDATKAILNETWSMLDRLLDSGLSPESKLQHTDLVRELGQEEAYRALCNR